MRMCNICKKIKRRNYFYSRGKKRRTEIEAICKLCKLDQCKKYNNSLKRPVKCGICSKEFIIDATHWKFCSVECQLESGRRIREKWHKENKDKVRLSQKKHEKRYPKRRKHTMKKHRLKSKYGLTIDEFKKILKKQKNKCAICKQNFNGRWNKPNVDHKHDVEKNYRGLLCVTCNLLIGYSKESVLILKTAVKYLEYWNGKGI